ncbi:MAG: TIGR02186 family protein [Paracoccus sp. (in: a-proteobacteria)]|nr:TIGR02186 family protein [Paracoccus sp. (in: a-proteobacteria)]
MRGLLLAALLFAAPAALAQQTGDTYPTYPDFGRPAEVAEPGDGTPPAERVVAGLSSDAVAITASFDGSDILIYGAIKRETPIPDGPPLQVIVTVEGPGQVLTIRRKARRLGIWVNTESLHVGAVPSFYVVATSAPLAQTLLPDYDTRYRISVPLALRAFAGPVEVEDAVAFTEALIRLREADGIYRLDQGAVHVVDQTLFRADVRLPANLIEGEYRTRIFLLRDGRVIDVHRAPIEVRKVGLERWLYRMAFDQPLLYGLMSLAVAVVAGWGASAAFRLMRRQ